MLVAFGALPRILEFSASKLCAPATVPTLSALTSSKPFHPLGTSPRASNMAFADTVHGYKFHSLTHLNGSNKYR